MLEEHLEGQEAALQQKADSSLWHNRDYLLLLSGQAISSTGTQLSQFAFPLLILAVTGSSAWAGVASGLVLIPYFLLGLAAGAFIDRWDRKRTMIICDLGRGLTLASIPLALFFGHLLRSGSARGGGPLRRWPPGRRQWMQPCEPSLNHLRLLVLNT